MALLGVNIAERMTDIIFTGLQTMIKFSYGHAHLSFYSELTNFASYYDIVRVQSDSLECRSCTSHNYKLRARKRL